MQHRPRRSALYMPASNGKAIDKARSLPCDIVILDLEDAVAPDAKAIARAQAVEAIRQGGFGRREMVIRCNGLDTPWGAEDLAAAAAAGPDAILAPKVNDAASVAAYDAAVAAAPASTQLWAMIETCRSILRLEEIAATAQTSRLTTWVMGLNDLAKEMGARQTPGREPFAAALALSLTAARAYGLGVLDGVYNDLDDEAGFETQCRQGVDFGFDGKTLIHPRQIETCNRIFSPSQGEVAHARAVVAAFALPQNADKGALRVEGRMVERLHLGQAQALIAMAETIAVQTS
jgi:citrate lyase subunit beta / citryl-CoA lyase